MQKKFSQNINKKNHQVYTLQVDIVSNCDRNHHAKFEIVRTMITLINTKSYQLRSD